MFKAYMYSKISTKLYLGFLILIVLILFVSLFSVFNFNNSVRGAETLLYSSVQNIEGIKGMQLELTNIRKDARLNFKPEMYTDPAEVENFKKVLKEDRDNYKAIYEQQVKFLRDSAAASNSKESRDLLIEGANEHDEIYKKISKVVDDLIKQVELKIEGKFKDAEDIGDNEITPVFNELEKVLKQHTLNAESVVDSDLKALQKENRVTVAVILVVTALTLLIAVIISILTYRNISLPITEIANMSAQISKGNLNINLPKGHKGEIQYLSDSLGKVINVFNSLMAGINKMSEEMQQGKLSSRINEEAFTGDYKNVSKSINTNLDLLLNDINKFLSISEQYAKGDFSNKLEKLPGEKVVLNNTLDVLESNLLNVSKDIQETVNRASKGNFEKIQRETSYTGVWKYIIDEMDKLMVNIKTPLQESISVLNEVSKGNLDVKIKGQYEGDYRLITETVNKTVESLNNLIYEISTVLENTSNKDLTTEFRQKYLGDFEKIKNSIENVNGIFSDIITEIANSAGHIVDGVATITSSTLTLSEAANNQNTIVGKLTDSMTKLSEETGNNLTLSNEVVDLAKSSSEDVNQGNKYMSNMMNSMNDIESATNRILNIIKVIDDIAFQTNLLALNAAVEAARAGEHGKGFAVVADEVRSLAMRCKNAAKETEELISDTVHKVKDGSQIASKTSETLNGIVVQIGNITENITNVSSASEHQTEAIQTTQLDIDDLIGIAQTNAAVSQETASIAEELSSQSEMFKQMISEFKTKR